MSKNYTENDLEAALKRAFVDKGFEAILIDGWIARNEFLNAGIHYGINQGWLKKDSEINESQYTAINYALTDKGKEHFGLA